MYSGLRPSIVANVFTKSWVKPNWYRPPLAPSVAIAVQASIQGPRGFSFALLSTAFAGISLDIPRWAYARSASVVMCASAPAEAIMAARTKERRERVFDRQ